MELIKPKARKALVKQVRKLIKQYGAEATVGIISGLVGSVVTDVASKKARRKQAPEAAEPTAATPAELAPPPPSVEGPADASPTRVEPTPDVIFAGDLSSQPALASAAEPAPVAQKPRRKARPAPDASPAAEPAPVAQKPRRKARPAPAEPSESSS